MSLSPVLSLSPEFYSFFFHMPFETWQVHDYRIGYIYCAFALKVCLIMGDLYASCGGAGIAVNFDVSVVIQRIEIVNHERVIAAVPFTKYRILISNIILYCHRENESELLRTPGGLQPESLPATSYWFHFPIGCLPPS